jgi:signal transduction histidine kinase
MKPLRVLMVEDNERDAALLLHELRRGGYEPISERVDNLDALLAALERQPWDIVISDYSMPRFSGPAALAAVRERNSDVPFMIISGTIGEEIAVEAMRAGAQDFMVKGTLARLLPAIERELREAAVRAERKKMRDQLLMSERMASVGILAASVAHEINNPLTVITANLELAIESLSALAASAAEPAALAASAATTLKAADEQLREAQHAAERVRNIARDLRIFSRSSDEERRGPVDIRTVLDSSIRMASNEIRHRARLVTDYADVPPVEGNESRLGQVFLNLVVNAAQSIPDGNAEANEIGISTRLDAAGRVVVAISDTGAGISPEVLPRIFDPFFTTKPSGIGTGLGLAICHGIGTALDGEITVESEKGRGTIFRVALPAARVAAAEPAPSPVQPETAAARRGRVLIVDDEPMLCMVAKRILGGEHDVTAVSSAREALRLITGGGRFDVILSDLMMPEMTGMDLHAELLRVAPDEAGKMVFMTGGAFTPDASAFLRGVANPSVEKPFRPAVLRQMVQTLLK